MYPRKAIMIDCVGELSKLNNGGKDDYDRICNQIREYSTINRDASVRYIKELASDCKNHVSTFFANSDFIIGINDEKSEVNRRYGEFWKSTDSSTEVKYDKFYSNKIENEIEIEYEKQQNQNLNDSQKSNERKIHIDWNENSKTTKNVEVEENQILNTETVIKEPDKKLVNNPEEQTLRQKFDVNNEEDFNKLLETYAEFNAKYYDGHKRNEEEIKKRRNMNAQFKRIIDKKVKNMIESETSTESNFAEKMEQIESGKLFSNDELENAARNKGASLKLFQIMSSGVYEKNGERIKLTQKQRVALASTLQKVSEFMLGKETNKKTSEVGIEVKKVNTSESEKE